MVLDENEHNHHPSLLRDDGVLCPYWTTRCPLMQESFSKYRYSVGSSISSGRVSGSYIFSTSGSLGHLGMLVGSFVRTCICVGFIGVLEKLSLRKRTSPILLFSTIVLSEKLGSKFLQGIKVVVRDKAS